MLTLHSTGSNNAEDDVPWAGRARRPLIAAAISITVVVAVAAGAAFLYLEPQPRPTSPLVVSLVSSAVLPSDRTNIELNIQMKLYNSGTEPITFYGALYQLSGDGAPLDSGYIRHEITLQPGSFEILNSTLTATPSDTALDLLDGGSNSMYWSLSGTADLGTMGGNQSAGFDLRFRT